MSSGSTAAQVTPTRVYYLIFAALLMLTALTVEASTINLGRMNVVAALVIAVFKAVLVLLYFMELRYSNRLTWLVVGAAFVWLVVLISFTMSDMLSRGWLGVPGR